MQGKSLVIGKVSAPTGKVLIGTSNTDVGIFKNLALGGIFLTAPEPQILDANGYPNLGSPTSDVSRQTPIPSSANQSDIYVLKFAGTADVKIARGAPGFTNVTATAGSIVGGTGFNLELQGTNARATFQFATDVPSLVTLSFVGGGTFTGVSGLVFCKLSDEPAIDAATRPEHLFSDEYVNKYQEANFGVTRPMGWTNPNDGCNVSQSRYIPAWNTALDILCDHWLPGAWAGSTSGNNAYTCSNPSDANAGAYVDREVIQVKFVSALSGSNPTLNRGSLGAKPLLDMDGKTAISSVAANTLATCVYVAALGAFLYKTGGQTACMPYELQVAFANRINAHYWLNFHPLIDDTSVPLIVAKVATYLRSTSRAYFEYMNECWNFGFPATAWADAMGIALGFPSDNNRRLHGWYGLRVRQIMAMATTQWATSGRDSTKLRRVMALQAYGPSSGNQTYRLNGSDLSTALGYSGYNSLVGQNYNSSPNRPIDYCDVLSYATYYSGAKTVQFDATYVNNFNAGLNINSLTTAADDYASGTVAQMASALSWLDGDIKTGTTSAGTIVDTQTLQDLNGTSGAGDDIYGRWETVAASYDGSRSTALYVECYEGGLGCVAPSAATCTTIGISTAYSTKIGDLIAAYQNSQLFYDTTQLQYTQFMSRTHSVTPAQLLVKGPNAWSLSTGDTFTTKKKSWYATKDYNG